MRFPFHVPYFLKIVHFRCAWLVGDCGGHDEQSHHRAHTRTKGRRNHIYAPNEDKSQLMCDCAPGFGFSRTEVRAESLLKGILQPYSGPITCENVACYCQVGEMGERSFTVLKCSREVSRCGCPPSKLIKLFLGPQVQVHKSTSPQTMKT